MTAGMLLTPNRNLIICFQPEMCGRLLCLCCTEPSKAVPALPATAPAPAPNNLSPVRPTPSGPNQPAPAPSITPAGLDPVPQIPFIAAPSTLGGQLPPAPLAPAAAVPGVAAVTPAPFVNPARVCAYTRQTCDDGSVCPDGVSCCRATWFCSGRCCKPPNVCQQDRCVAPCGIGPPCLPGQECMTDVCCQSGERKCGHGCCAYGKKCTDDGYCLELDQTMCERGTCNNGGVCVDVARGGSTVEAIMLTA